MSCFSDLLKCCFFQQLILFLIIVTLSCTAIAEDDESTINLFELTFSELLQVKITVASGFEQPLVKTPSTVTVVTEEQWTAMGATTLAEVLDTIPGIHITLSRTALTSNVYSIRGLQASLNSQVMVLIDGEYINASSAGSTVYGFTKALTPYKQIEVLRGPGSAIYGANSFSGVINLVTKKASEKSNNNSIGLRFGTFSTRHVWLEKQGTLMNVNFRVTIDLHSSDDNNRLVNSDLQTTLDGIFGTSASLAPGVLDNQYNIHDLTLNIEGNGWSGNIWHYRNNNAGLGPGVAQVLDPSGYMTNGITFAKISYDLSDYFSGSASVDFSAQREIFEPLYHIFPAGAVLPIGTDGNINFVNPSTFVLFTDGFLGNPYSDARTYNLAFTHIYEANKRHKIRWQVGANLLDKDISETKNFGPDILNGSETLVDGTLTNVDNSDALYSKDVKEHYTFLSLQDEWQITDNLSAVLGVRYDNYESFGSTTNPRVGLVWNSTDKLTTKIQYGSAFRAPTSNERFFRNNPVSLGNENLKPEKIDTFEVSLDYQWHDNLHTNLTVYQYHATNFIEFVFNPDLDGNIAQNTGQQDGNGFELSFNWRANELLNLELNYARINSEDGLNNETPDIAKNQYYAAINWQFANNWLLHARVNRISDRIRPIMDNRDAIANYNRVNISIQRKNLIPNLDFALIVNNATDQDNREPSNGTIATDYPLAGRQVSAELSYTF